jgi:hypothetical protein
MLLKIPSRRLCYVVSLGISRRFEHEEGTTIIPKVGQYPTRRQNEIAGDLNFLVFIYLAVSHSNNIEVKL